MIRIQSVSSIAELQQHRPAWQSLLPHVLEQNLNYEPAPLLALLKAFSPTGIQVLLFWQQNQLLGIWPLQHKRLLPIPLRQISTFYTEHMMACTPLVHRDHVDACIDVFISWIDEQPRASIFSISEAVDKSLFWPRLLAACEHRERTIETVSSIQRAALLDVDTDPENYFQQQLGSKSRSNLRRKMKRLQSNGEWRLISAGTEYDLEQSDWQTLLNDLIKVEASGWKSDTGSAITHNAAVKDFVQSLAEYAHVEQRLFLLIAYIGQQAVAGQIGIINDREIMIYKLGHEQSLGKFSPGSLLMMDVVRYALQVSPALKIDSCAEPHVRLFNDALQHKRNVKKLRFSSHHLLARLLLKLVASIRRWRG